MSKIQKIAVLGSGVMGSGIAALIANAGVDVVLMDIVPEGSPPMSPPQAGGIRKEDAQAAEVALQRNRLASGAIEKQLKASISGFTTPANAKRVRACNFEDDLDELKECDLIIEAVLERLDVKHKVYAMVESVRKDGSIVSSNTSTLPLATLTEGMNDRFKADFCITHFFNPPRFMRLLEVLPSPTMDKARYDALCAFADVTLGKGIVHCKDTPGFLANRIGVFWMLAGLIHAQRLGISVEAADAIMGKPLGFPKTGMFGLYDLIGIDLMPLIAEAMMATLPKDDAFRTLYQLPDLVKKMIAEGYTGRKGKGGFTRMVKHDSGKKTKEVIDLKTGEYRAETKVKLESVDAAKAGLAALFSHPDIGGQYAASVMGATLHYAASLVPQISDDIVGIDEAMKLGYNWKYGPFEMIDRMKTDGASGAENAALLFAKLGLDVPPIIAEAKGKTLYRDHEGKREAFGIGGAYTPIIAPTGSLMLEDIKRSQKPIAKNPSAQLWDLGDGVACLELTSKQNTFDPENLKFIMESTERVKRDFTGLVIGGDAENFSFGANIGFFLLACNSRSWWAISDMVSQGQVAFMGLKYAPFPVVSALSGMALGGGCELQLHADAVQAHMESYPGLVEVGIGVIPGWGGCKEMLWRHSVASHQSPVVRLKEDDLVSRKRAEETTIRMPAGPMPAISKVFEYLSMAKVAGSADEARLMGILNAKSRISMNRRRVLSDAKSLVLEMAEGYAPPETTTLRLPGATGFTALKMAIGNFRANGKATAHDEVVSEALAYVLTGGNTDITQESSEQDILQLEQEMFMQLCKTEGTRLRIAHMLETSKPLRN